MLSYFLRRLLLIVPTFIGITLLVFAITRFVPGGPVERAMMEAQMASNEQSGQMATSSSNTNQAQPLSEDQIAELKAFYGLDKPFFPAYVEWFGKVLRFDLGESTRYYIPVWDLVKEKLPVSTFFGVTSFLIGFLISIPLGIAKALRHGSKFDSISSMLIFIGFAIPSYIVGIFCLFFFAFHLEMFPTGGFEALDFSSDVPMMTQFGIMFSYGALPLVAYTLGSFATGTLTMKNSLMENLSADYVRTAVAKGLPFKKAVVSHAMRNSLIPIASSFGGVISVFLGGSFLIEVIFNIDGLGLLGYEALVERDYPIVMGTLAISSFLLLLGNVLSDLCVALVDPRIQFGS